MLEDQEKRTEDYMEYSEFELKKWKWYQCIFM